MLCLNRVKYHHHYHYGLLWSNELIELKQRSRSIERERWRELLSKRVCNHKTIDARDVREENINPSAICSAFFDTAY